MTPSQRLASRSRRRASKNTPVGAGLIGTALVAVAQTVGVHTPAGQMMLYAAPILPIIASAVFATLHQEAGRYGERWQTRRVRRTIERQLRSTHTSDDHKSRIRELLENLDQAEAEAELARLNLLRSSVLPK